MKAVHLSLPLALCLSACVVRQPDIEVVHFPVQQPAVSSSSPGVSVPYRDAVRQAIALNRGQIRACYEKSLETSPNLAGRVTVRFVIGKDGRVRESSLASSTVGSPELERCVVASAGTWTMPPPQNADTVIVTYPFFFKLGPAQPSDEAPVLTPR